MATIRVKARDLPQAVAQKVRGILGNPSVASILVDRAKKRIRAGGDSTVKYPELWSRRTGIGFRKGGRPLRDTGRLMNMLNVRTSNTPRGVQWTLTDGTGYGLKHQEGFVNHGPTAVPLTKKAKDFIQGMGDPPHDIETLDKAGFEEAPNAAAAQSPRSGSLKFDYYIIEGDSKVPARPIANNPPEDVRAISRTIKRALVGV